SELERRRADTIAVRPTGDFDQLPRRRDRKRRDQKLRYRSGSIKIRHRTEPIVNEFGNVANARGGNSQRVDSEEHQANDQQTLLSHDEQGVGRRSVRGQVSTLNIPTVETLEPNKWGRIYTFDV